MCSAWINPLRSKFRLRAWLLEILLLPAIFVRSELYYVVPVAFSYEPDCIYTFSTFGKKIEWMRKNPKVCLQADEIGNRSNWTSVVVTGTYLELNVPQYHTAQREHARERLAAQCSEWWQIPLSGARDKELVSSMETVFFRIDIKSMSGLRAIPEAEEPVHQ